MPHDAASATPAFSDVAVAGGALRVASFAPAPAVADAQLVLGIHGITGSSMQLAPVARALDGAARFLAPDLRGRGASNDLPGPFGIAQHATDCAAVLEQLGGGRPAIVLGESMGAFVAVVLAASRPDLVERLVLADGGLPAAVPEGLEPDDLIRSVVGPAIDRLGRVFGSREDYLEFWRGHPALAEEWTADVEAYLDYDLESAEGGVRPRARREAVRRDGIDVLVEHDLIAGALETLACDLVLLRACRNLVNEEPPLYPRAAVEPWQGRLPRLRVKVVPDTNHYTLFFGAAGVEAMVAEITRAGAE